MYRRHSVLMALIVLLVSPPLLQAQTVVAVTGLVEDESQAVIPGATITLLRQDTGATQRTASRRDGTFIFEGLSPGKYVLNVAIAGFDTHHQVLSVGPERLKPLKIALRVASLEQDVTVEGDAAHELSASGSDAATTRMDDDLLHALPIAADDVLAVIGNFLAPAAQGTQGPSILVDGVEGDQLDLPASAISRVRINRNPYAAAFQHPGKARVEVTTKRGHRSRYDGAFEMSRRGSQLAARNAFARSPSDLDRQLLQPTLGGPLLGKKSSFYLSAERLVHRDSAVVNAVTLTGPFVASVPTSQHRDSVFTRMQWWPSALHTISGTYGFSDHTFQNRNVGGVNLPERAVDTDRHKHKVTVTDSLLLPPRWQNQLLLGVTLQEERTGRLAAAPAIVVKEAFASGPAQSFTQDRQRTLDVQNTTTYYGLAGHVLVFGARYRGDLTNALEAANFGGTFEFASLTQYAAGAPLTFRINRGDPHIAFGVHEASGFVQDEMHLGPRLTLTGGLRYDWQSTTRDRNNLGPRIAFAFAPAENHKTVVRGGAGIFYDDLPRSATQRALQLDGVRLRELVIAHPSFPDPFLSGEAASTPPSLVRVAPDLRSPYMSLASLAVEHELWHRHWVTAEYSFLRGAHVFRSRNINAPLPFTDVRPSPDVLNIDQIESTAFQRSHALTVTWRGRVRKFLESYAQYVFSTTTNDTSGIASRPSDNYDLRAERGPADYDCRHRFNLVGVVAVPGAIQVGLVLSVISGAPFNITTGFDNNGDSVANDRPPGVTRNTGRGPGTVQFDVRLAKTLRVSRLWSREPQHQKRDSLDLAVDILNAINRTNVTSVVGVLSSPFFGRANSAMPARSVQFSVRYGFRR